MDYRPPQSDQPYAWDDERLSAYLDGELSAPEQAQLEARLVVDPELRQLVDELRAVRQQLEILPEYRLQATFAEQVLRRAEQEMLLVPLGRETLDSSTPAVAAAPAVSAAVVQPAVAPLPPRSAARLWRRGAIWTAIAAAAVLLLIVTNQPGGPEQNHVARHDLPQNVMADPRAAKTAGADAAALPAEGGAAEHAGHDQPQDDRNGVARKRVDAAPLGGTEQKSEAQKPQPKQAALPLTIPSGDGLAKNGPAAASKPADATVENPAPNQLARAAGSKKQDANQRRDGDSESKLANDLAKDKNAAVSGKMLLKNQAAAQPAAPPASQSAQPRPQLPRELAALLASDEFAQLAASRTGKFDNVSEEEQVLVVHLTPRAEPAGDRSFESLLASNSIELADKSFAHPEQANRQRPLAAPAPELESPAAEPLGKAAPDKKQDAGTMDRKSADMHEAGKSDPAVNGLAMMKEKSRVSASELSAQQDTVAANELYYLEAEASQVEELLRQLRASPDRFARLSIVARGLPQSAERANFRAEKTPAPDSSPSVAKAESDSAGNKRGAENALADSGLLGKQPPLEQKQFAQGAAPAAPPASAPSAGTSAPPAAEPAAMPFSAPAPAVTPPSRAAAPAPAAVPSDAPATLFGAASSNIDSPAGQASRGQTNAAQEKEELGNDTRGNRRALPMDKSLEQAAGARVVAYRLRGVESLQLAKDPEALRRVQDAGGGFGGGAGKAKASETEKSGANGKPNAAMKSSAAAGELKIDGVPPGQDANNGDAALPAKPAVELRDVAPRESAEPEKRQEQQAPTQAGPTADPDSLPAPEEASPPLLTRNKETVTGEEKASAEAAKKSVPAASKRVRVLFVIKQEPKE